jgi:hypothetical protein
VPDGKTVAVKPRLSINADAQVGYICYGEARPSVAQRIIATNPWLGPTITADFDEHGNVVRVEFLSFDNDTIGKVKAFQASKGLDEPPEFTTASE